MYRIHLLEELLGLSGRGALQDTRILETGPRDGHDSKRMTCIAQRGIDDSAASHYAKSELNPDYLFGDAT